MKKHNFSAGPSILSSHVLEQASQAVLDLDGSGLSILEISHRSPTFIRILEEARALVLELSGLQNKGYQVLFLQGGASMEFLRIPYNLMGTFGQAAYLDTGLWASKAKEQAERFGKVIIAASSKDREYRYIPESYDLPQQLDYFHCTSNNTIYGTQMYSFPKLEHLMVCDMSSDIFSRVIDFSDFGLIYAGAQKNLGISGVSLVIVKEDALGKTNKNIPNILDYQEHILKENLYNTPPVFAIYTVWLTLKWLKEKGLREIEQNNEQKASLLYNEIDRNPFFEGIAEKAYRSKMNVTFALTRPDIKQYFDQLCIENGISGINGHRTVGNYRASIYNAMPLESVQVLVDVMQALENL